MRLLCLLFALFLIVSCREELEVFPEETMREDSGPRVSKGHLRVKLSEAAVERLAISDTRGIVETGIEKWDVMNQELGAYRIERTFPPAGKFEERQRKWGLHRWYDIYFDENVSTRSASEGLSLVDGIEVVEEVYLPRLEYQVVPAPVVAARNVPVPLAEGDMPFNDPRLAEQWHYNNTGQVSPWRPGADINLFEAWKSETGNRNVIVAVLDEGVDVAHEDLYGNIWVNSGEIAGNGIDDDGNGYVDDVNGYNFAQNKGAITAMTHGTHVAGTVAAMNGNGIGVCGIAGGTADLPGVRIMACQMIGGTNYDGNGVPRSFVYAANNGASIAQCSWSYDDIYVESVETAIQYFVENAGYDESGNQMGPMAGGLAIFAAANQVGNPGEDKYLPVPFVAFPASLDNVFSVTAVGPSMVRASYANYGGWVDIAAPGGDLSMGTTAGVLSTDINNTYAWLQGTSMAAPHVSGVAALILSKYQGMGFTAADLWELLEASARPELYLYNPDEEGELGKGLIDAAMVLDSQGSQTPPESSEMEVVAAYNGYAVLEWELAAAEGNDRVFSYRLAWEAVDAQLPGDGKVIPIYMGSAGDMVRDTVRGLRTGITYRFTLTGYDRWNNASAPTETECLVEYNAAPDVERLWSGNVFLDETESMELVFRVNDREGHAWKASLGEALDWVSVASNGENVTLRLAPGYGDATEGVKQMTLIVKDEYGAASEVEIPFEVRRKATVPELAQQMADMSLAEGKEERLLLEDYFRDLHGDALSFEVESSNVSVCSARISGRYLVLKGTAPGYSMILVRGTNSDGLSVSCGFRVDVSGTTNL